MALEIGTSGWTYPHWQKAFFPSRLPSAERLRYYAERFNSVEVNTTFYGTPKKTTVRAWGAAVPARFTFAIKASRYITHNRKLLKPRASSIKLFRALEPLADRVTAMLFQLPPFFGANVPRLRAFLKKMPADYRYAFEFRHPTWFCEEVADVLRDFGAAFCLWDLKGRQSPLDLVTAPFVYVRLHGPTATAYRGSYPDRALRGWGETHRRLAQGAQGRARLLRQRRKRLRAGECAAAGRTLPQAAIASTPGRAAHGLP